MATIWTQVTGRKQLTGILVRCSKLVQCSSGGMDMDFNELWKDIPPFGFVQWFVVGFGSLFLILWTVIIGIVILQYCARIAGRLL